MAAESSGPRAKFFSGGSMTCYSTRTKPRTTRAAQAAANRTAALDTSQSAPDLSAMESTWSEQLVEEMKWSGAFNGNNDGNDYLPNELGVPQLRSTTVSMSTVSMPSRPSAPSLPPLALTPAASHQAVDPAAEQPQGVLLPSARIYKLRWHHTAAVVLGSLCEKETVSKC